MTPHQPKRELCVFFTSADNPEIYAQKFAQGLTPNKLPYGLEFAPEGWKFTTASAMPGRRATRLITSAFRFVFGVDVITALRARKKLCASDFVYAHAEREYLGAALALILSRTKDTILVGQTIWLFHDFDKQPWLHRVITRRLMRRMDALIYNAAPNYELGRELFPDKHHVLVPFGVSPRFEQPSTGSRSIVLSVGHDSARDWPTLADALRELPSSVPVRIATAAELTLPAHVEVRATSSFAELLDLYRMARVVVLALKPNSHASGVTTMLEAAAAATPVIATRAGGLDEYFTDDEVTFVAPGDSRALSLAIRDHLADPRQEDVGLRLQDSFRKRGYDSASYWGRITEVIETLSTRRGRPLE